MERFMEKFVEKTLSFAKISVKVERLGDDYFISLCGGDKPHIGCVVLAIPRPSLTGDGSISVTSSVLNVTGHKDEMICRRLAENVARKRNAVTICAGGFHTEHITRDQIGEVIHAVEELENMI